jgi:hypothetical protein
MDNAPPILPEAPPTLPHKRGPRGLLVLLLALGSVGVVVLGSVGVFSFLWLRDSQFTDAPDPPLAAPAPENATIPEADPEPQDFSASDTLSIVLGENEAGQGVRFIARERDGLTTVAMVNGKQCRRLDLPPAKGGKARDKGYFYFALDPSFKQGGAQVVRIEVEYCSESTATLALQYDAIAASRNSSSVYTRAGSRVALDGSSEWETAAFHIRNGAFENAQNGGADFRLEITPPELSVRRVTVTREREEDFAPLVAR